MGERLPQHPAARPHAALRALHQRPHPGARQTAREESRSSYRAADEHPPAPQEWEQRAVVRQGSWWPDYDEWLAARSGELKPAPKRLGNARFKATAKAPGSYVHAR